MWVPLTPVPSPGHPGLPVGNDPGPINARVVLYPQVCGIAVVPNSIVDEVCLQYQGRQLAVADTDGRCGWAWYFASGPTDKLNLVLFRLHANT